MTDAEILAAVPPSRRPAFQEMFAIARKVRRPDGFADAPNGRHWAASNAIGEKMFAPLRERLSVAVRGLDIEIVARIYKHSQTLAMQPRTDTLSLPSTFSQETQK